MVCIHVIAVSALVAAGTYIYLNETGRLEKADCKHGILLRNGRQPSHSSRLPFGN